MRKLFNNQLNTVDLYKLDTTHTNIPKIKEGHLSAQFWAAYVPCETQYKDAVRQTLEQIDVIHRMCHQYPEVFKFAASSEDIMQAFSENKTASLIGVEGGHSIDSSLGTLRTMYQLGARYLTLTHSCNTPWADNWLVDTGSDPVQHDGLSDFGKQVIQEMNRIGMMIDLAHVPVTVMKQVLEISEAPVIFSHSSAYSICKHKRNVPDDVLMEVKRKEGIVMVNFYNDYVTCQAVANISDVADHFDHIKKVADASIIGFGGDYDGVTRVPEGLEDVSKYPDLVAELLRRKWTDDEIRDALGRNLIRVFKGVEAGTWMADERGADETRRHSQQTRRTLGILEHAGDSLSHVHYITLRGQGSTLPMYNVGGDIVTWWVKVFDTGRYPGLNHVVRGCLSIFHGPMVESSFSTMGDIIDNKSTSMTMTTFNSIQTTKYTLRSRGQMAIQLFKREDVKLDKVNKVLCRNIHTSGTKDKA
ncbi:Dipeptidase 1 [Anabarilius grahami]|uniref:Dipeptidase n=1 Tax=Anabarilius grahami TaxID=495550 RepID=A0A3N0Y4Q6_ANAGA|nr:Dipeptidase 1 [Anabarilius grahami]